MLGLTYLAEIWSELTLTSLIGQVWGLPLLIAMVALNLATVNKWVLYAILVLLLSYPNGECITSLRLPITIAIQIGTVYVETC